MHSYASRPALRAVPVTLIIWIPIGANRDEPTKAQKYEDENQYEYDRIGLIVRRHDGCRHQPEQEMRER